MPPASPYSPIGSAAATEQLVERAGSTIDDLLNVSFGNTAELVLALFILSRAQTRVVQAQITGSIIGTTLLFLGISALVGGVGRARQTFSQASAGLLSTLLFLVVIAILLPAVFDLTERTAAPGANVSAGRATKPWRLGCSAAALRGQPRLHPDHPSRRVRRRRAGRRGRMEPTVRYTELAAGRFS